MADYGVRITLAAASPVPAYTGGPWVSGVAKLSSSSGASGWSSGVLIEVSAPGESVDIAGGGNYASVSDADVVLFASWVPDFETSLASLFGATIEIGTISGATLSVRWSGVVSDLGWSGSEYRITAESLATLRHREIPARILSGDEFAGLPTSSEGIAVPALYGAVERLTSPSIQSNRDYLVAMEVYAGTNPTPIPRSATMIAQPYGAAAPTLTVVPVLATIQTPITDPTPPDPYGGLPWWFSSAALYMEVTEGTGSGQRRKLADGAITGGTATLGADALQWYNVVLASPLDTLPDVTSAIRFYSEANGAVLVVADEGAVSSVTVQQEDTTYPIGFSQGIPAPGTISADVSAEFVNGEDYAALVYLRTSNNYGEPDLNDGITVSATAPKTILPYAGISAGVVFDALCRGEIYTQDIPDSAISGAATVAVLSSIDIGVPAFYEVALNGERWEGTIDHIQPHEFIAVSSDSRSSFSSSILPDGTPGNYSAWAIPVSSLPVPLRGYRRLQWAICVRLASGFPSLGTSGTPTMTNGSALFSVATGPLAPAIGQLIRAWAPAPGGVVGPVAMSDTFFDGLKDGNRTFGINPENWYEVVNVTGGVNVTLDRAWTLPTGAYGIVKADPADLISGVEERESGIAFSFGAISPASTFLVNVSSGRNFGPHWAALPAGKSNGDPITDAKHIAQDIFLRDLAIPQADIGASYLAMPAYTARVALVDQEDSASILARMCREFNWVGAHDNTGRETLSDWLTRIYTATADYAVVNAEIVADSITGVDATSLDDIVTLPRVSWDWTQADGFRGAGTVTDCSADPSTLTASNYLRTISGFGDFATALAAYQTLHEAWRRNGVRRSEPIEYRYGGNPTDLLLPARLEWAASRKDLLQFKLNESHAASGAYLGQRISVTHRRYTGGGTVYGTLVARYWFPADGQIQLTVMLDPVDITAGDNLFVDTIDPTATIEQYTDQFDGVSEQHTDTLGA